MATPPPFRTAPPPQPTATNSANKACLIAIAMVLGLCLVGGIVFAFVVKQLTEQFSSTAGCVTTFKLSRDALIAYAREHKGHLPQAATWQDDVRPYYQRLYDKVTGQVGHRRLPKFFMPVPPGEPLQCKWSSQSTGVAFNVALSGKELAKIKDPDKTPLVFETDRVGTNLALPYVERPRSTAPKFINSDRDWIVCFVEGERNPFQTSGSSTTIEIGPDDALDPAKPETGNKPSGTPE